MTKSTANAPGAPMPNDRFDELMHAVALVILRRQMRGRWTSSNRSLAHPA